MRRTRYLSPLPRPDPGPNPGPNPIPNPHVPSQAGDYFVAHSAMREVTIEVVGLSRYPSFGAAWSALGPKLLPAKVRPEPEP